MTLEDEQGLINVILRPNVYEKYRQVSRLAPIILVEGVLQKRSGVINVVAMHMQSIQHHQEELPQTMPVSRIRNFA
jgi:error-prone DNA polymerase